MTSRATHSERYRLLLVEDDRDLSRGLLVVLGTRYEVAVAEDAPEALALLRDQEFDLILLDLILPRGTGFEVLDHLEQKGDGAPAVLLMSSVGSAVDVSRYPFVCDRLQKPFQPDQVEASIKSALNRRQPASPPISDHLVDLLLVDDNPSFLEAMTEYLTELGYQVLTARSAEAAMTILSTQPVDVLVSDWIMPGLTGMDLLRHVKEILPDLPVVLMSGHGAPSMVSAAMAAGAVDVLTKPFPPRALPIALEKCRVSRRQAAPGPTLSDPAPREAAQTSVPRYRPTDILGKSLAIERAQQALHRAAATDSNVLLLGETGVGKELFAHALHRLSRRSSRPFVAVNAAAIPESLLEAELFGYVGGSFTGARREGRMGRFQQADGGTLFLDEVGDLPLPLQAKLLRVLQEGEVDVVGGGTRRVDFRLVAATNQNLTALVEQERFRKDLFYRINVIRVEIPALRDRREDILILAEHFMADLSQRYGRSDLVLDPETIRLLTAHSWPGNVRELRNVVERAFVFAQGSRIMPLHLPEELRRPSTLAEAHSTHATLAEHEAEAIKRALKATGGNKVQAARMLGISRAGLYNKLKEYGLN